MTRNEAGPSKKYRFSAGREDAATFRELGCCSAKERMNCDVWD
jgi:hypothetical protein